MVNRAYIERCAIIQNAGRADLVESIAAGKMNICDAEKAAGLAWVQVHPDIPTRWVVIRGDDVLSIDHNSSGLAQAWATEYNRKHGAASKSAAVGSWLIRRHGSNAANQSMTPVMPCIIVTGCDEDTARRIGRELVNCYSNQCIEVVSEADADPKEWQAVWELAAWGDDGAIIDGGAS